MYGDYYDECESEYAGTYAHDATESDNYYAGVGFTTNTGTTA